MSSAAIGLLGVVAGAVATGGSQLAISLLQRRNDALAAARITWGVLENARLVLEGAEKDRVWAAGTQEMARGPSVWSENRLAVARSVDAFGYQVLEIAFLALAHTLEQAGEFDEAGLEAVIRDERFREDLFRIEKARLVARRAGQTWRQRLSHPRKVRKFEAELNAELASADSQSPAEEIEDSGVGQTG